MLPTLLDLKSHRKLDKLVRYETIRFSSNCLWEITEFTQPINKHSEETDKMDNIVERNGG